MKNLFILSVSLMTCIQLSGQAITRSQNIYSYTLHLVGHFTYENDSLSDVHIQMVGKDDAYPETNEFETLFSGTPIEMYNFLIALEKFSVEPEGTSTDLNNGQTHVTIWKLLGKKVVIYAENEISYTLVPPKTIPLAKEKYVAWCKKNNIQFENAN